MKFKFQYLIISLALLAAPVFGQQLDSAVISSGGAINSQLHDIKGQGVTGVVSIGTTTVEIGGIYPMISEEAAGPGENGRILNTYIYRTANKEIKLTWEYAPGITSADIWRLSGTGIEFDTGTQNWAKINAQPVSSPAEFTDNVAQVKVGDKNNAYYRVVPVNTLQANIMDPANNNFAVGKFDLVLAPGYNLVSLPILPKDTDLDVVVGTQLLRGDADTADVIFGDVSGWKQAYMNDTTGKWQGSLTQYGLYPDKGYWIRNRSAADEILTVVGRAANSDRSLTLSAGWNLIGTAYPRASSFTSSKIASGSGGPLAGGTDLTGDQIFADISGWKQCYLESNNTSFKGSLMDPALLGDAGNLRPPRGYWVNVRQAGGPWPWTYPKPY